VNRKILAASPSIAAPDDGLMILKDAGNNLFSVRQ
jgi:hypothetical protein